MLCTYIFFYNFLFLFFMGKMSKNSKYFFLLKIEEIILFFINKFHYFKVHLSLSLSLSLSTKSTKNYRRGLGGGGRPRPPFFAPPGRGGGGSPFFLGGGGKFVFFFPGARGGGGRPLEPGRAGGAPRACLALGGGGL